MSKKKKLFLSMALVLVMMTALSFTAHASAKSKAFKAYRSWINSGCKDEYGVREDYKKFCLVYLDSDKVPELIGKKTVNGAINNMCIVSYKNGKLVVKGLSTGVGAVGGFRGDAAFIPGKGKIYMTSISSGTGQVYDYIVRLKNAGFKFAVEASYRWINPTKNTAADLKWNGKKIGSKKSYDKKLAKAFAFKKGKSFDKLKFVSEKKMLSKLK